MTFPKHTLKELVFGEGNFVEFARAEDHNLWYEVVIPDDLVGHEVALEFPVPFKDTLGAVFLSQDSPKFFMKWIRQRLEYWARVEAEQITAKEQS